MPSTLRSAFSQLLSQGELPTLPRSGGTSLLGTSRVTNDRERGRTGGIDRVGRTGTTVRESGGRGREKSPVVDESVKKKKVSSHARDSLGVTQDIGGNHGVTSSVASKNLFDSDDDELVEAVDTDDDRRVLADSERRHHRFQSIDVDSEDDGAAKEDLTSQVGDENRDNISCIKLSEGESTSYLGKRSRRGGGGEGGDFDTQRSTTSSSTRANSSRTFQQHEPHTSPTAIFARRKEEEAEDRGRDAGELGRDLTPRGEVKGRQKNTSRENRPDSCSSSAPCHSEEEEEAEGEDVLKILIATDTHLGYKADDNVRGGDSFETFEEILQIGRKLNVDFLLHGGDLFDDNKPSRTTL